MTDHKLSPLTCHVCGELHIEEGHEYIQPVPKGYFGLRSIPWSSVHGRMHINHLSSTDKLEGKFDRFTHKRVFEEDGA